ncbi:MAG: nucleoid occlusion protein [Halanaerobium sp.]
MKFSFFNNEIKSDNEEIKQLKTADIQANPFQPRQDFKEAEIEELAESISKYGLIQPIVVRKAKEGYELIAGERRLRAAKKLKKEKIPAVIRDFDNREMAEIALVENLQRKDLNFIEEASAYKKLLDEFNLTQKELAEHLAKSQSTIANKLRLLNLSKEIRDQLIENNLSERHGRALLKLDSEQLQKELIAEIGKKGLTVRESEKLIKKRLSPTEKKKNKIKHISEDLRLFANSLEKRVSEIKESGIKVDMNRNDNDEYIEYYIKLEKK